LAGRTARRVATHGASTNLLPPEFASRYRQQFVDRLWMRGIGSLVALYVLGVLVYFGFVQVAAWRHGGIQDKLASLGQTYTNTLQLRERLRVLQDTLELQYAALDCYKSAADTLPSELTLNSITFERGRRVTFFGTSGAEDRAKINEFNSKMIEYAVRGQRLYSKVNPPNSGSPNPQAAMTWNFSCDLKRTDITE
jgi:hypothetical protein